MNRCAIVGCDHITSTTRLIENHEGIAIQIPVCTQCVNIDLSDIKDVGQDKTPI